MSVISPTISVFWEVLVEELQKNPIQTLGVYVTVTQAHNRAVAREDVRQYC